MRPRTLEIAFDPRAWTPERARETATLFDGLAPDWRNRDRAGRDDAFEDALARGDLPRRGIGLEIGSGTGMFTSRLAEHFDTLVAIDLSIEMLKLADAATPRVCADAAVLPVRNRSVQAVVLANCFLFPGEVDRVLADSGTLIWVSSLGELTPIYLSPEEVIEALPGPWRAMTAAAGWGSWAVFRRR